MNKIKKIFLSTGILFYSAISIAQVRIAGKVYDESGVFPIESVSVLSNSGNGTVTNKSGWYELTLLQKDSIWFSYLGKTTAKFFVADIIHLQDFNISIQVPAPTLPAVTITGKNYRLDSINNRIEYQKAFNYQKPSFRSIVKSVSITGFVIDIDEFIRLFQFREKRIMMTFKKRLIDAEQQKFIARKFNNLKIKEVIRINDTELENFILLYTPDYFFTLTASEYEMKKYIKESYEKYKSQ